jgi:hypothetical protein
VIDELPADWRAAISSDIDDQSLRRLANSLAIERARTDTKISLPRARFSPLYA